MVEEWKLIAGYNGKYLVSNLGRVKVAKTVVRRKTRFGTFGDFRFKERVLKPFDNGNGYLVIGLTENGKVKNHYIHRLVAAAFLGEVAGKVVNHLDCNPKNNCVSNLEIVTQKSNVCYSRERMSRPKSVSYSATGEKHIRFRKNRYFVEINHKGKLYCCGGHSSLEEAVKVRNAKYEEVNYYG